MTVNPQIRPDQVTNDPIVNEVIDIIVNRHLQGMEKFGRTMDSNDRPLDEWIAETIEELIDAIHYLVKARTITDKFKKKNAELEVLVAKFKERDSDKIDEVSRMQAQIFGIDLHEVEAQEINDMSHVADYDDDEGELHQYNF